MQETPWRTVQDVAHCDAGWEPLRVAVGEAANECFAGNQERPWKRDRMCKEAPAERLNMVERVRLHNEVGAASEGIGKELADKLAFSSSLCRRMRRRYRRARQRRAEAERQEALTRQQMSEARRLAHSLACRCRRTQTATIQQSRERCTDDHGMQATLRQRSWRGRNERGSAKE